MPGINASYEHADSFKSIYFVYCGNGDIDDYTEGRSYFMEAIL